MACKPGIGSISTKEAIVQSRRVNRAHASIKHALRHRRPSAELNGGPAFEIQPYPCPRRTMATSRPSICNSTTRSECSGASVANQSPALTSDAPTLVLMA
jgi:hypothetical protein